MEHSKDHNNNENEYIIPNITLSHRRLHSFFRKISLNVQREEGTPDKDIILGTPSQPTEHERKLMLNQPVVYEDYLADSLPTVEEIIQESTDNYIRPSTSSATVNYNNADLAYMNQDYTIEATKVDSRAKIKWRKSLNKVKMMNSLSSFRSAASTVNQSPIFNSPLISHFPLAFAPLLLSMYRDEHGRRAISITDSDIDQSSPQRPLIFRIELQYREVKWVVYRSLNEFYNLHLMVKAKHKASLVPSFPSHIFYFLARTTLRIPNEEDKDMHSEASLKKRDLLETYLRELVHKTTFSVKNDLSEFLELSALSLNKTIGWKGKEGYLEYLVNPSSPSLLAIFKRDRWIKEWVILRDSYLIFCKNAESTAPTDIFLFDIHFKMIQPQKKFGSIHQTQLILSNSSRQISIKSSADKHIDKWINDLNWIKDNSPWVEVHRYNSYAPERRKVKAKWFVDGHDYYAAVAEAILSAKSEIFIEDWWLSPQLCLKRPPKGNEEYRLDRLLQRKAVEGVKIYIVVYKNVTVALPLDSQHTRDWMHNIHPNIVVQRHANLTTSPFWAHHEKILVVDYKVAFVGGLDLCFGRYDSPSHTLTDCTTPDEVFPGQDYSNPRIKDFYKVSHYRMELIDKKIVPRMPWHDIHTAMTGLAARDVARHFIQRWNFIKTNRLKERPDVELLLPRDEMLSAQEKTKFEGTCNVQLLRSSAEWSLGIEREFSIYNAYMKVITEAQHFIFIENQFFITTTNKNDKLIKNKIGRALVERIKKAHQEGKKFRVIVVIPVAPGFEGDFTQMDRRSMPLRSVAHYHYQSISRGKNSIFENLRKESIPIEEYIGFYSLRKWDQIKPSPPQEQMNMPKNDVDMMDEANLQNGKNRIKKTGHKVSVEPLVSNKQPAPDDRLIPSEKDNPANDVRLDIVTEQIYIHSKLMIVDDRIVICGSANLNDRSQLGNRDSEIAVIIEDTDMVDSQMNGEPYKASRYALSLRMQLFKEHLGLLDCAGDVGTEGNQHNLMKKEDMVVMDPLSNEFYYGVWNRTAHINTEIYRELFRCIPDNTVHTIEQHRAFVPDPNKVKTGHLADPWEHTYEALQGKLNKIQGHLIEYPTDYLKDLNMNASVIQDAFPPVVFT